MTVVYAVKTGQSVWDAQHRVENAAGSPLTEAGEQTVRAVAQELVEERITAVFASSGESELQTAKILAKRLDVKVRRREELRELDYGLLQGLTHEELKRRHAKLYKLWREAPEGFRAPSGETLDQLRGRLRKALREITRKHKGEQVALVLRPVALGVVQCILQDHEVGQLWSLVDPDFTWTSYETSPQRLKEADEERS